MKEALKQALEALHRSEKSLTNFRFSDYDSRTIEVVRDAIAAEDALADVSEADFGEPTVRGAPARQPLTAQACAYRLKDEEASKHYGRDVYVYYSADEFEGPNKAKVIALLEPLYTRAGIADITAAPEPARQPLTQDEMFSLVPSTLRESQIDLIWFGRAIERAHGIGQEGGA